MARLSTRTSKRIGKRIQRLRKSLDYTQEDLAEFVGISRTHMGHVEQGRKIPSLQLLEKVAKKLRIKLDEIFS